eukprot:768791-Hanusia_phi.AAC.2
MLELCLSCHLLRIELLGFGYAQQGRDNKDKPDDEHAEDEANLTEILELLEVAEARFALGSCRQHRCQSLSSCETHTHRTPIPPWHSQRRKGRTKLPSDLQCSCCQRRKRREDIGRLGCAALTCPPSEMLLRPTTVDLVKRTPDALGKGRRGGLYCLHAGAEDSRHGAVVVGRAQDAIVKKRIGVVPHKDVARWAGGEPVEVLVELPFRTLDLGNEILAVTGGAGRAGLAGTSSRGVVLDIRRAHLTLVDLTVVLVAFIALERAAVGVASVASEVAVLWLDRTRNTRRVCLRPLNAVRLVETVGTGRERQTSRAGV